MSVAKVVELIAQSPTSWEDATQEALQMASKTLPRHQKHLDLRYAGTR